MSSSETVPVSPSPDPSGICPRQPWAAAVFSALCCGLGHVYCGRIAKGLVLLWLSCFAGVGVFLTLLWNPTPAHLLLTVVVAVAVTFGIWLYGLADAVKIARGAPVDYRLKDYNRWYIYAVLISLFIPLGVAAALVIRGGIAEAFYCPAESMLPTVRRGDRFLVNRLAYRSLPIQRGDVVVFINPNNRFQKYVKRVVALPGDTVAVEDGVLSINGKPVAQSDISAQVASSDSGGKVCTETLGGRTYRVLVDAQNADLEKAPPTDLAPTKIPNGRCFVLGDNRNRSRDSRVFGTIPLADVIGRAEFVYFPRWASIW